MGESPLVSVALATYNGERYLRRQLDSILAQTYRNIEIVVSDDCSRDGTAAILDEYRRAHGITFQVNEHNLGFVRNFERALAGCSGEFIALSDQDDIWLPEKIETLVREIGSHSLIYTDALLIDENDQPLPGSLVELSGVRPVSGNCFEYFVCTNCVTGCTAMFRRDLLATALPIPETETYHDWWLALVASRCNGVVYHAAKLTEYRQHAHNHTGADVRGSLPARIADYLMGKNAAKRRGCHELLANRARRDSALADRLNLTPAERSFLEEIGEYAESLLSGGNRMKTFALALKHRDTLFPAAGRWEKLLFVFSRLIAVRAI
uniref:Glycosyltransferase family 2 protein n=1 Tax=Geobacter metallireducens TaxID=28232 RepID=A0A831UI85_GEOME